MKTILLAEDDPFIVNIYFNCFKKEGYKVYIAKDGRTALEKIRNNYPDLMILDVRLPKESNSLPEENEGWEILRTIRGDIKTKNLKVIVFSNIEEKDYPSDFPNLGVAKHFLKVASTPEEIINSVKEILK